jgi:stage II sporulation protein D
VDFRLEAEPAFDIGLAWDLDSALVVPGGPIRITWRDPGGERSETTSAPVVFRASGAQVLVDPRDRERAVPLAVLERGDTVWVGDPGWVRGDGPALGWNGKRWRGRFKVFMGPRGKLTVATRVALETYLLGVVPAEIGALKDSLVEAGRAQAVAARSYSLFYRGRRGAEGFDLYSTVEDQVYGSIEAERPLATRCVTSTTGLTALAEGGPIRANYHATCGGILAEAWEAWPTEARSYLVSRRDAGFGHGDHCDGAPNYRWRETWTAAEFMANVARFAPTQQVALPPGGAGELVDVDVLSRSRSGRVWELRVRTTTGELVVPAHSLRQVLRRGGRADQILRSNLFKIAVERDPATSAARRVVASGAGSGHGVGLCQVGALSMAREGATAEQILRHYYAGVDLRRLY